MARWMLCLVALATTAVEARGNDHQALQGTWIIESAESGGRRVDLGSRSKMQIHIQGDLWTAVYPALDGGKGTQYSFRFQLHTNTTPRRYTQTDPHSGEVVERGIYRVDGRTLTICFSPVDTETYPGKFQSFPAHMLVVLRRVP